MLDIHRGHKSLVNGSNSKRSKDSPLFRIEPATTNLGIFAHQIVF